MKCVVFNRLPEMPVRIPPSVEIIADSAVTPAGRPMFIPDFAPDWSVRFYPALRVSRLGKDIAPQFAERYFDAFTLALRLTSPSLDSSMRESGSEHGLGGLFDYCLALGDWQKLPREDEELSFAAAGLSTTLRFKALECCEALSAISRYATLKTGDIVMPCRLPGEVPVKAPTEINAGMSLGFNGSSVTLLSLRLR